MTITPVKATLMAWTARNQLAASTPRLNYVELDRYFREPRQPPPPPTPEEVARTRSLHALDEAGVCRVCERAYRLTVSAARQTTPLAAGGT